VRFPLRALDCFDAGDLLLELCVVDKETETRSAPSELPHFTRRRGGAGRAWPSRSPLDRDCVTQLRVRSHDWLLRRVLEVE